MTGLSPQAAVAVGIIVGLLSTCVQSFGLTLQRKSHMLEAEKDDYEPRRPAYRRRRWQVGMFLFLIANIVGSSIQITTLPLPLLSTLQASGLVFNSLLASLLLKEPWTWRTAYGTILVAAGAVLISYFSALPEPSHNLRQLLNLLAGKAFLIWLILSVVFVGLVLALTFTLRFLVPVHQRESPRNLLINGMSFGLVSGILSAHALLLAKSAVELIVRSLADHDNQFNSWQPWILLLAFAFLSLSQLYYLHLGLRLISTSILYPFVFCIYNIVAILDGLIYFQQMNRLPPLHAGLIALGTALLLAGVLALSWRLQDDEESSTQPSMARAEIPQTVLAPGMGFVGDPDTDTNDSESMHSDDGETEREVTEHTTLLRKSLQRSSSTTNKIPNYVPGHSHIHASKRRHRAATLKEVRAIWDALGDNGDADDYGTFEEAARPGSSKSGPQRQAQTSQQLQRQRQRQRRRSSTGKSLVEPETPDSQTQVRRAVTMPPQARSRSSRRRRSAHGSALFSDMLHMDWWRARRKVQGEDDDGDSSGAA